MTMTVNTVQAKELIIDCLESKLVPMITGSPGGGKSALVSQIAQDFNLKVIDMRLSQCDPTDLLGFPKVTGDRAEYIPMITFPLEGDSLPTDSSNKPMNGWLLFLDEFNSAPLSVQAASYKLVLDRAVGVYNLHENVAVVCAGNKSTDNAIVNRMSTAMQSRMIHLELESDSNTWLDWAHQNDIDFRVTSYINFKPNILNSFNPDHDDKTFPCGRTWEFMSRLISKWPTTIPDSKRALLAGTVGEGTAREFMGFCKVFQDLPTIAKIIGNPLVIQMPTEPSILYAVSGTISAHAETDNIAPLIQFVQRMPIEFQVITLQDALKRNRSLLNEPSIKQWISDNAKELY
jgi:hypothetical protein